MLGRRLPCHYGGLVARVFAASLAAGGMTLAGRAEAQTSPAPQPPSTDDLVVMKDGTTFRGSVVDMMPGDHATLKRPSGEIAVIRWDNLTRIERAVKPTAEAPAVATPVRTVGTGQALVHIQAPKPVAIERRASGRNNWSLVCEAPCDVAVDLNAEYRVVGSGVRTSSSFQVLAQPGGRVVLDVATGSRGGFGGGIVMVSIGMPVLVVGTIVLAISGSNGGSSMAGGWVVTGIGLGSVVGGILLVTGNARSRVVQSHPDARPDDRAQTRAPIWAHARLEGARVGQALAIPIFSSSF